MQKKSVKWQNRNKLQIQKIGCGQWTTNARNLTHIANHNTTQYKIQIKFHIKIYNWQWFCTFYIIILFSHIIQNSEIRNLEIRILTNSCLCILFLVQDYYYYYYWMIIFYSVIWHLKFEKLKLKMVFTKKKFQALLTKKLWSYW